MTGTVLHEYMVTLACNVRKDEPGGVFTVVKRASWSCHRGLSEAPRPFPQFATRMYMTATHLTAVRLVLMTGLDWLANSQREKPRK